MHDPPLGPPCATPGSPPPRVRCRLLEENYNNDDVKEIIDHAAVVVSEGHRLGVGLVHSSPGTRTLHHDTTAPHQSHCAHTRQIGTSMEAELAHLAYTQVHLNLALRLPHSTVR